MTTDLIARRAQRLGPNLPTFYDDPVHIVRGEGAHLWDADGRRYIDCYNNVAHVGDAEGQTRAVLETIKSVIETAGGTMDDVTMNHIFLKDWADYAAMNKVYAEYFPGDKPARFCIVCGLVRPDFLVEIASIAHIGKRA